MSSSMLEQAVIDAQTLKDAAIKNAEQEVLEKYSGEIKEAVNMLLEQEEDPMAMDPMAADPMAADPMAMGDEAEADPLAAELPMKATDGENACPCPEEGAEIELELDLGALKQALSSAEEGEEMELPAAEEIPAGEEELGGEEMLYEASRSDLEGLLDESDNVDEGIGSWVAGKAGGALGSAAGAATGVPLGGWLGQKAGEVAGEEAYEELTDDEKEAAEEVVGEAIELDEETLKDTIEEILKVDLENVPRGMLGTTHPTKIEQIYAVDIAAAADEDTARKEENAEFEKAVKKIVNLEEQVKSLKSSKNRLVKEHNELKSVARQVSDKLAELNLANAKLVYQNRILESNSLNERQKNKLVEAVSNANSTEEAKVIYETLQDSLASKGDNSPKNLSEAVSKNNRLVLKSNKKETQVSDSATERMKRLAGII